MYFVGSLKEGCCLLRREEPRLVKICVAFQGFPVKSLVTTTQMTLKMLKQNYA